MAEASITTMSHPWQVFGAKMHVGEWHGLCGRQCEHGWPLMASTSGTLQTLPVYNLL